MIGQPGGGQTTQIADTQIGQRVEGKGGGRLRHHREVGAENRRGTALERSPGRGLRQDRHALFKIRLARSCNRRANAGLGVVAALIECKEGIGGADGARRIALVLILQPAIDDAGEPLGGQRQPAGQRQAILLERRLHLEGIEKRLRIGH